MRLSIAVVVVLVNACSAKSQTSEVEPATTGGAHSTGTGGATFESTGAGMGPGGSGGASTGVGGQRSGEIRVIRGDPNASEWWDLTIRGAGLMDVDGKIVTARVGDPNRPPERLGSGEVSIVQGSFELYFPKVWEPSYYKVKVAFIDTNDDGRCDPGVDRVYRDARATPHFVLTLQNGPKSQMDMAEVVDAEGACAVMNATWPTE